MRFFLLLFEIKCSYSDCSEQRLLNPRGKIYKILLMFISTSTVSLFSYDHYKDSDSSSVGDWIYFTEHTQLKTYFLQLIRHLCFILHFLVFNNTFRNFYIMFLYLKVIVHYICWEFLVEVFSNFYNSNPLVKSVNIHLILFNLQYYSKIYDPKRTFLYINWEKNWGWFKYEKLWI